MRRVMAVVLLGLVVQASAPIPAGPRFDDRSTPTLARRDGRLCWSPTRGERGFARRINGARGGLGLGRLRLDPQLSKAARVHTREMARTRQLYHTPSSALRRRVTNWSILGENVGYGGGVASLHSAFMDSPAHRQNVLLGAYKYVGVGVKNRDGRKWVTVLFEGHSDPGTSLWMRRRPCG